MSEKSREAIRIIDELQDKRNISGAKVLRLRSLVEDMSMEADNPRTPAFVTNPVAEASTVQPRPTSLLDE